MEKKFVKVSHDDIEELHLGMLGSESLVVEEREIDFVKELIEERDYSTAGLTLCDLGHFNSAREIIEKLKMKQEIQKESEEKENEKKEERKLTDIAKDFINGTKAV